MKPDDRSSLEHIRRDAERRRRARRRPAYSPLRGLSAFGVIGWSVVIPSVGGALLGVWLDRVAPARFSWPIALMLGGLLIGVIVAWDWIAREDRAMEDDVPAAPEQDNADA